jgi:uncharacterized protein
MKCPNCNETLIMADRQGIEIDYCPNCRGVWLDRGELDKIIERSASYVAKEEPKTDQPYTDKPNYDRPHHDKPYYDKPNYDSHKGSYDKPNYNDPYYRNKKKKGFLSDFFDFD